MQLYVIYNRTGIPVTTGISVTWLADNNPTVLVGDPFDVNNQQLIPIRGPIIQSGIIDTVHDGNLVKLRDEWVITKSSEQETDRVLVLLRAHHGWKETITMNTKSGVEVFPTNTHYAYGVKRNPIGLITELPVVLATGQNVTANEFTLTYDGQGEFSTAA